MYKNKSRHPFIARENRRYRGILYVVDRLDFAFEQYDLEMYVKAEYEITHYREMQTLKFELRKNNKPEGFELPKIFTLYKKTGIFFEPYENVKSTVFRGNSLAD